jgi:hypothetical protein
MWIFSRKKSSLYKLERDYSGPPDGVPQCWITNIDDPNVEVYWCVGKPMPYPIPPTIIYEVDIDVPLKDLMDEAGGPILASDRLARLIRRMSSCAACYDSEVRFKGKVVRRDCKTVHLEAAFDCLDMSASKFDGAQLPVRLRIDEEKIPPGEHIFRIEKCLIVVCDRVFIEAVESLGITGCSFDRMWRS